MNSKPDVQPARYGDRQVLDYNLSAIGELLPGVLERGQRQSKIGRKSCKKLSPTNSERMNRALLELGASAFKIHTLLWKWRGAPARGYLPFFTIHSLSKFCGLTRPTVRSGLTELHTKGWIQKLKYNKHVKNALYRLIPIRDVPAIAKDLTARVAPAALVPVPVARGGGRHSTNATSS